MEARLRAETELACIEVDELDVGAHEVLVGRDDGEALEAGGLNGGGKVGVAEKGVIEGRSSGVLGDPEAGCRVSLGIASMTRTWRSLAASDAARLMAVVVLPTPPFWLAIAITLPKVGGSLRGETNMLSRFNACVWQRAQDWWFHVEQLATLDGGSGGARAMDRPDEGHSGAPQNQQLEQRHPVFHVERFTSQLVQAPRPCDNPRGAVAAPAS